MRSRCRGASRCRADGRHSGRGPSLDRRPSAASRRHVRVTRSTSSRRRAASTTSSTSAVRPSSPWTPHGRARRRSSRSAAKRGASFSRPASTSLATGASSSLTCRAFSSGSRPSMRRAQRVTGFFLPGQPAARVTIDNLMLNGAGSIQHAGNTLLISHPESGALFTEYSPGGYAQRSIGRLRATGFEDDRELHVAMNAGLPLVDPTGGFYLRLHHRPAAVPQVRRDGSAGLRAAHRRARARRLPGDAADALAATPRRGQDVPFVTPSFAPPPSARTRRAVDLAGRAVHLRLRQGRRQDSHRAVPGRRSHQPDQSLVQPAAAACS